VPCKDFAELLEHVSRRWHCHSDRHLMRHTFANAVERRDLRRQDPHRLVVALELTADENHCAGFDQAGGALIRLREGNHFHATECVFERKHRHAIAFSRLQLPARGDDPANAGVGLNRLPPARPP
jgi:hypothetical protein